MRNKKRYLLRIPLIIFKLIGRKAYDRQNILKIPPVVNLYFFNLKKFFDWLSLLKRHPSLMISVATILPISQSKTGFAPINLVKNPLQSKLLVVGLMETNLPTGRAREPLFSSTIN